MIPGFLVLAAAQAAIPAPTQGLRRLVRAAACMTLAAGVVRVSDPRCPQPAVDAGATSSDIGHGAASIATFVLWTAMPVVAARDENVPSWYRRTARWAMTPTVAAFITAGVTTRMNSSRKGLAQRTFLAVVFAFLGTTGFAGTRP